MGADGAEAPVAVPRRSGTGQRGTLRERPTATRPARRGPRRLRGCQTSRPVTLAGDELGGRGFASGCRRSRPGSAHGRGRGGHRRRGARRSSPGRGVRRASRWQSVGPTGVAATASADKLPSLGRCSTNQCAEGAASPRQGVSSRCRLTLASHCFVSFLDERLRQIEICLTRDGDFQIAGSKMADL